ncbi:sulfurtransferase [Aquisalimonas sp. 2447]|uniref:sulfurtransferase n=1 Tax=Aquisalimonas sp. 2447 TaxID=2740807 RepID=UPI001432606D|nr:rhodanese-like domain-containing protein [Aquisalimonas sp. 2447]QIT55094.1 sulfurtransferase [Aquisalimonas sp. 2447]
MSDKILYSVEEAEELVKAGEAVILDIRDADKFAEEHIPGSVNVSDIFYYLAATTDDGLAELHQQFAELFGAAGLDGSKTAIVCEDALNTQYGGSCRGYWLLSYLGYPSAGILDGGIRAWKASGRRMTTDVTQPEPVTFPLSPRSGLLVTKAQMLAALDRDDLVLLDNRDRDEWLGESSSPYGKDFVPRKGRLPGALWLEWYELMDDSDVPAFKSSAEIREIAGSRGIAPDDDVIIYCFKGARASNTFVALRQAGFRNLRIYLSSWNEWSKDASLPIESGIPGAAARPVKLSA